jgi:hypothetical protein
MSEFMFVLKSFLITVVLIVLMQVKIGTHSAEAYAQNWLTRSSASLYVQSVAAGGAMALRGLALNIKRSLMGSHIQSAPAEAGR